MRNVHLLCCVTLVLMGGSARAADNDLPKEVREAFDKASEFELYSLDPARPIKKNDKDVLFHDWKVLGKTTLKGEDARKVRSAIDKGRKDSDGLVAACFNPRHGVRFVRDKKTYDIVICYECLSATIYEGEKRLGQFLTTQSPAPILNRTLENAEVPLPKQRGE